MEADSREVKRLLVNLQGYSWWPGELESQSLSEVVLEGPSQTMKESEGPRERSNRKGKVRVKCYL